MTGSASDHQALNDNTPSYDITGAVDGYRVWVLKPTGKPGAVVASFNSLSSAARFVIAARGQVDLENVG